MTVSRALLASAFAAAALTGCAPDRPVSDPRAQSPIELDHVWIAVSPGAPERRVLEDAGLRIALIVNRHDGQGTASVTFEFHNAYLELLWPDDGVPVAPGREHVHTRFRQRTRWRTSGLSPFGVQFRRTSAPGELPFRTWPVRAEWMPPGESLQLLEPPGAASRGASLSITPPSLAVDESARLRAVREGSAGASQLEHPIGVRQLTAVRIVAPKHGLTAAARQVDALGAVEFRAGTDWLLELTFDGGERALTRDLRPDLPLILRY